ncbi:hypothetical protein [Mesorhizobium sp. M0208]
MGARLDGVSDAKAPGDPRRLAPYAVRIAETRLWISSHDFQA